MSDQLMNFVTRPMGISLAGLKLMGDANPKAKTFYSLLVQRDDAMAERRAIVRQMQLDQLFNK